MFGIGGLEFVIILVFVLLIFGPERLPEIGKMLGRGIKMFQSAKQDVEVTLKTEVFKPEDAAMMRKIQRDYDELKSSMAHPEKFFTPAPVKKREDEPKPEDVPTAQAAPTGVEVSAPIASPAVADEIAALERQLAEIKKRAAGLETAPASADMQEPDTQVKKIVREKVEIRTKADDIWEAQADGEDN